MSGNNQDNKTVAGFGDEWSRFDQSALSPSELKKLFAEYFAIFPWDILPENPAGFDLGCGSGRWARLVAPRVGKLHCIDASKEALKIARANLKNFANCRFHHAGVGSMPLMDNSMDFGYVLGVLHHIPDPLKGLNSCVAKIKPGAPLLVYLYYSFDNRPYWYKLIWRLSDFFRKLISRLPHALRYRLSQIIAALVYYPLARISMLLAKAGLNVKSIPLSDYRDLSFYTMRTDALDRFGTLVEQRFSKNEIRAMMEQCGLENIVFSPNVPYWCAVGYKRRDG